MHFLQKWQVFGMAPLQARVCIVYEHQHQSVFPLVELYLKHDQTLCYKHCGKKA